jgi:hypothetical protein
VIVEKNLFRRLGWGPEPPRNPFTLVGVITHGRTKKALLSRDGAGVYAAVGEDVGHGYKLASIDGYNAKLTGGPMGELTIELNQEMLGAPSSSGGGAPTVGKSAPPPSGEKKPQTQKRWYPRRGAPVTDIIREILEREGISWEQVEKDKDLQNKLKSKYQYLEDEGYTQFPK